MAKQNQKLLELVDCNLYILEGNENKQMTGRDASNIKERPFDKEGHLNENALAKLKANTKEMKYILQGNIPTPDNSKSSTTTKGVMKCQLYIPEKLNYTSANAFGKSFIRTLKDASIKCQEANISSLSKELPLLVTCPLTGRLNPCVEHALQGFEWNMPYKVIIINLGTETSLPELPSSIKIEPKPLYQNAEFIDMGYNDDNGIYDCPMNNEALLKIKQFLERKTA